MPVNKVLFGLYDCRVSLLMLLFSFCYLAKKFLLVQNYNQIVVVDVCSQIHVRILVKENHTQIHAQRSFWLGFEGSYMDESHPN